jgi:catechol 2,3-dioxygenase-like lactoylglutathione lyase family enzyme
MSRLLIASVLAMVVAAAGSRTAAQMLNAAAPIRVGHYHLNVTSVDEHKKFWVDTLGGTAVKVGQEDAIRFGDVLLLLRVSKPSGGTRGTTFDHIGFAVPSVPELTTKVVANGYQLTKGRESQPAPTPAAPGTSAVYGRFSYLVGPDGFKVELVTAPEAKPPATVPAIAHHHVHYVNPQYVEMGQWYMKALDATLRPGQTDFFFGADLPGIGYMLNFFKWEGEGSLVGTKGRALDHVGYEVRNLEAFTKGLAAKGIALVEPYRKVDGIGYAMIVDPWGTQVELTEGFDRFVR